MPEPRLSESNKRRRTAQGEQTYQAILQAAMNIASVEGLEGVSIGRLARELNMSKSGLFAHFGSKEELQLATIEAARAYVVKTVVRPALRTPKGLQRLQRLCEAWLNYTEDNLFPGGCFFAMTAVEFKSRPGTVRDRLAAIMQERLQTFARLIQDAQRSGELAIELDRHQLAFEIDTLLMGANWTFQLYGDPQVVTRTRQAIQERLQVAAAERQL
ncbi:MAG: TetR/AcrR family transcriptional regulator [Microcoleaceae cyanobacterium]